MEAVSLSQTFVSTANNMWCINKEDQHLSFQLVTVNVQL